MTTAITQSMRMPPRRTPNEAIEPGAALRQAEALAPPLALGHARARALEPGSEVSAVHHGTSLTRHAPRA